MGLSYGSEVSSIHGGHPEAAGGCLEAIRGRGVPSGKKTVARSFYRVTQQVSLAWIDRFFKIWVHMKALILLFHRRYDS